jgi:hypothetical protein
MDDEFVGGIFKLPFNFIELGMLAGMHINQFLKALQNKRCIHLDILMVPFHDIIAEISGG